MAAGEELAGSGAARKPQAAVATIGAGEEGAAGACTAACHPYRL